MRHEAHARASEQDPRQFEVAVSAMALKSSSLLAWLLALTSAEAAPDQRHFPVLPDLPVEATFIDETPKALRK